MNKTFMGAVCAVVGVVSLVEAYKLGYNKGVDECKRMLTVAMEVAETVKKKES